MINEWILVDHLPYPYGGFLKWGYPNSWMVFVRENPIKVDDLGVSPFMETPISHVLKYQASNNENCLECSSLDSHQWLLRFGIMFTQLVSDYCRYEALLPEQCWLWLFRSPVGEMERVMLFGTEASNRLENIGVFYFMFFLLRSK